MGFHPDKMGIWRSGCSMLEDAEHFGDGGAAAKLVLCLGGEIGVAEGEVFLHAVAVAFFGAFVQEDSAGFFNEDTVVLPHFFQCGCRAATQLAEEVGIAHGTAADEEPCGAGSLQTGCSLGGGADVAIGQHRAGQGGNSALHVREIGEAAVELLAGAGVDAHFIRRGGGQDFQNAGEFGLCMFPAEAAFDAELPGGDGPAEFPGNFGESGEVAQQPGAGAMAVDQG